MRTFSPSGFFVLYHVLFFCPRSRKFIVSECYWMLLTLWLHAKNLKGIVKWTTFWLFGNLVCDVFSFIQFNSFHDLISCTMVQNNFFLANYYTSINNSITFFLMISHTFEPSPCLPHLWILSPTWANFPSTVAQSISCPPGDAILWPLKGSELSGC